MSRTDFAKELEQLINKHSMENQSDTPDFILAEFMMNALQSYERAIYQRTSWYGIEVPIQEQKKTEEIQPTSEISTKSENFNQVKASSKDPCPYCDMREHSGHHGHGCPSRTQTAVSLDEQKLDDITFHVVKSARGFGQYVMEVELRPEETGELLYLARMGLASLKAPADTQLKPTPDMVGNAEHTLRVATDATADNYAPLKEAVISWAVYWQDTGDNTMLGEAVKRLRTAQSSDDRNKDG
jgi:hypothetical protein